MFNRFLSTNFFPLARTMVNNNAKSLISTGDANMSLYENDNIGDDEIEDAVQNRCHKMIRTSYRINKRIGSKKVNETYL